MKKIFLILALGAMVASCTPDNNGGNEGNGKNRVTLTFEGDYWNSLIDNAQYNGDLLYKGKEPKVTLSNVKLWWCAGHGEQNLYTWKAIGATNALSGRVGLRRVKLVMNGGNLITAEGKNMIGSGTENNYYTTNAVISISQENNAEKALDRESLIQRALDSVEKIKVSYHDDALL